MSSNGIYRTIIHAQTALLLVWQFRSSLMGVYIGNGNVFKHEGEWMTNLRHGEAFVTDKASLPIPPPLRLTHAPSIDRSARLRASTSEIRSVGVCVSIGVSLLTAAGFLVEKWPQRYQIP